MSTQLFLRLTASDLGGAGQQALSVTRGAASHTAVTNTTASGTNIQVTATAAGQALTWFSPPLAGNVGPIAGSITVNIWGFESSASANAKAGITIEHTDSLGNVLSTIVANTGVPTTSSEYGLTPGAAKNASFTPTSTALNYGDRIKVTLFVKNQGTMGAGFTVTNSYDGPTAAAAGDTYVTFTENLFPPYSGGPQGWSSPAGIRAAYVRTGLAMASQIPLPASSSPVILTASLPDGPFGQPYTATLSASGGTLPYTWSISSGSLPAGLSLAPSTGIISGTPTGPPGTTSFTVKVTDSLSNTATQPLSITTTAAPVIPSGPVRARITPPPRGRTWSNPGGPVRNPVPPPAVRLPQGPVRAKLPYPRRGQSRYMRSVPNSGQPSQGPAFISADSPARARIVPPLRGRVYATKTHVIAVVPPPAGPVFRQATQPARARVPQVFSKGRASSGPGAPLRNPGSGPVFRQAAQPTRARIPQVFSKGRVSGNPGTPVPPPLAVPPFRAQRTVRAKLPLPRRGTCRAIGFFPLPSNPQQGPVFTQATAPARIRPGLPPRGRIGSNPGVAVFIPPPPVGPVFVPSHQALRARLPQQPLLRGRVHSDAGGPLRNPQAGPAFRQAVQPVKTRLPQQPLLRGRTGSNPGGPLPPPPVAVAPFRQLTSPARIRPALPPRGRTYSNAGAPLRNPGTGPVFRQATAPARIRITLPPRGRTGSNPGGPVPPPPNVAIFRPATSPARTRIPQNAPRGRVYSHPGAPLRNPNPGPVFQQAVRPVQARFPLPPRGRIASNPGAPVRNPVVPAPVYPPHGPVRAVIPQVFSKGRISSNPGIPVPHVAPFHPAVQPARIRPSLPLRGRIASNPGTPPPPPPVPAKIYPAQGPVRIRVTLPPRGRTAGNPGGPVRNPHPGPVFIAAVRPIRAVIPQNAPRGRASGNPGGPVENIPFATLRFRTGEPYFQWDTGSPGFQWATGEPGFQWSTGTPEAG